MADLAGKVAVVTGASRGLGKGIVEGLCEAGATVYFTGRSQSAAEPPAPMTLQATKRASEALGGVAIPVAVDHNEDAQVRDLFARVADEHGRLDILVNNVYQIPAVPAVGKGFWEHPLSVWDDQCGVGLRGYYVASALGAPLMVKQRRGLIVNVSSRGGREYAFSASYGIGKAGVDRMVKDFAIELRDSNVAAIGIVPSNVKTEFSLAMAAAGKKRLDPLKEESVRFSGRCVAALAADDNIMARSGGIYAVKELAAVYHFRDPDRDPQCG